VNPENGDGGDYVLPDYYEHALVSYKQRAESDPNSPHYDNIGFIHPEEMSVIKDGWNKPQQMPYFTATPELIALAKKANDTIPTITMPSGKPISVQVGGNGVTGSVFVDNAKYRDWLRQVFTADVAEMESAAVGQVCFVNDVDWIVIRSVSDLAGGQQGKNDENVFDGIASGTGTTFMLGLLDQIVIAEAAKK
jgi:adenosylhomocysteine nucleosidase